jgi:hypothetical protein
MSNFENERLIENAIELADELGGDWPEEIGQLVNKPHVDMEALQSIVGGMERIKQLREHHGSDTVSD